MTDTKPTAAPDDLDAAYAEIRKTPYVFTWAGTEWTLPHLGDLDFRLQMRIETAETLGADELLGLFDEMFGPEQAEAWAKATVPTTVLFMLFERWLAHSGAKPGEDSASSGSSKSIGKSSRRTSGGTTGSGSPKRSTAKKAAPAKKAAKRAPRKAAKAATADVLTPDDPEWIARHQAPAVSPPGNSSP